MSGVTVLDEATLAQGPAGQRYLIAFRTTEAGEIALQSRQESVPFYYVDAKAGTFDKLGDLTPTYALHQSDEKFAANTNLTAPILGTLSASTKYFGLFAADNNGRVLNNAHNAIFRVTSDGRVEKIGSVSTRDAIPADDEDDMQRDEEDAPANAQPKPGRLGWWASLAPLNVMVAHLVQGVASVIVADFSWRQYCHFVYNPKHSHFDYTAHLLVFFAFVTAYAAASSLLQRAADRAVRWLCPARTHKRAGSWAQWLCDLNGEVTREVLFYFRIFVYFSFCGVLAMCIVSKPIPEFSISFGSLNFAARAPMSGLGGAHMPAMGGDSGGGGSTTKIPPFKAYGGMRP